jgi:transposase
MVVGGGGSVMSSSAKRRGFDRGYKEAAVRLVVEEKRSVAGVARELGISANLLHRWKREFGELGKQAFPGKGHLPAEQEELRRLRQQLRDVTEERDILKKAIAVFTPKRPHGTSL